VFSAVDGGMRPTDVAELFEVDVSYIYKALIRRRTTGITTSLPWAEIRAWLFREHGVKVSVGCLWNTLER
jgi:hypothetical protein